VILPSLRYLLPALAMLAVTAGLVGWSELRPRHADPCRDAHSLRRPQAIPGTGSVRERVEELSQTRIQWSEGLVLDASGEPTPLRFHLIRDYNARRFFIRPFAVAVDQTLEPEAARSRWLETDAGRIQVHRVLDNTTQITQGARLVASYPFLYGNRPVSSPMGSKLWNALPELVRASPPVTMLLVAGALPSRQAEAYLERSDAWLRDAVERYLAVCGEA